MGQMTLPWVHGESPTHASILGIWKAAALENSTIEVYRAEDGYLYGKIIESDEEDWIGEVILKKVTYDADDQLWKGEIYSLRMFFSVEAELSMESEQRLKLVGSKWGMTKTFYWER